MAYETDQLVAEVALATGASAEEAAALAEVTRADASADALFAPQYQTENSPVHRAVWGATCPVSLFDAPLPEPPPGPIRAILDQAIAVVRRHQSGGTYLNAGGEFAGKLSDGVMAELGALGYYGMLIPREYGGLGLSFPTFALEETRMALFAPSVAMQNSVHEAIGAVGPLLAFGNHEQREWLRRLASGEPQSCFALTESQGGSDLKNMLTRGVIDGDEIVITGQKWFITNVYPKGLMCLVCVLEGHGLPPSPQVVLVELPEREDEHFWLTRYTLTALKELNNCGVNFDGYRVPLHNWIRPRNVPNGLTLAYHLLNRGRVSVCAVTGGRLRVMLAHMRLWGRTRVSMSKPIDQRDLPLEDYARMAGLIVCADAFRNWTAWLLDRGYRGELESGAAKVTVTRLLGEAIDRIYPQFWGGRALDADHPFAQQAGEMKAAEIYEGHNNMLSLAWFAALTKQHSQRFLMPIFKRQRALGMTEFNPSNPSHLWKLRDELRPYGAWLAAQHTGRRRHEAMPQMHWLMHRRAQAAVRGVQDMARAMDDAMREYREDLINRQGVVRELTHEAHEHVAMLITVLHANRLNDHASRLAAITFCDEQLRRMRGGRRTRRQHERLLELGRLVRDESFVQIADVPEGDVNMMWSHA
jgi:alkylation response protein AidB-like acyl-CoA dehydrogenase